LFEDSADANWLMDEKGFLDCNTAALQMFGYSAGDRMLHPADILPPSQPDGTPSRTAVEQISRPTGSFSEKAVYSCRLCFGVFALSVEIRLSAAGGTCVS
jgi:PAS domain-containing protein